MDKFLGIEKHELKKNVIRNNEVITLTWCDAAENHIGMENIGKKSLNGFNLKDLQFAQEKFEEKGYKCRLIKLNDYYEKEEIPERNEPENAYILVVEKGVICLLNDEKDDNTNIKPIEINPKRPQNIHDLTSYSRIFNHNIVDVLAM